MFRLHMIDLWAQHFPSHMSSLTQCWLGCGSQSVDVDKRILIHGEGRLGEASLDQRANSPAFRLRRAAVLRNLDVDMTGFREAVLVEGAAALRPLIDGCIIRRDQ